MFGFGACIIGKTSIIGVADFMCFATHRQVVIVQHHKIAGYGCDFGQGYYYGKPKFASDLNEGVLEAEVKERLRA